MVMTIKTHKLLQCAGMAIGGAIVCICGKNFINDTLEICAEEEYEHGIDDGIYKGFEAVNKFLIKAYGAEKANEIWHDIWPTAKTK